MNALVIGGTRFFGRDLVWNLLEQGVDVTLLTRGLNADPFTGQVRRLHADRTQFEQMSSVLNQERFDVVYDQVCYQPDSAAAACRLFRGRTGRYIFTSSMYVYEPGSAIKEEDLDLSKIGSSEPYPMSLSYAEGKRAAEAVFAQSGSFPVISVRFPIIIGQHDYTNRLSFHLDRLAKAESIVIPFPSGRMNYLSSHEAGRFLAWLKAIPYEGALNAASPEALSAEHVVNHLAILLNHPARIVREASSEIPTSPYHRLDDLWMDVSHAERLGFRFESFADGLTKEINSLFATTHPS